jgi:hypothetical protein
MAEKLTSIQLDTRASRPHPIPPHHDPSSTQRRNNMFSHTVLQDAVDDMHSPQTSPIEATTTRVTGEARRQQRQQLMRSAAAAMQPAAFDAAVAAAQHQATVAIMISEQQQQHARVSGTADSTQPFTQPFTQSMNGRSSLRSHRAISGHWNLAELRAAGG